MQHPLLSAAIVSRVVLHRFHNRFSQSQSRPLLVGAFNQEKALVGAFSVTVQLHRLIVYSTTFTRAYREHNPSEDPPADVQIDPRCRSSCVFCGLAAQFVSPRRPLNVYTILVNTQEGVSVLCSSQNLFKRGIMFQHN